MLRFFRQIRQRLLTGNRFGKYLLYAIGEILLVVVGILIALQIDNANEYSKQKQQLSKYEENRVEVEQKWVLSNLEFENAVDLVSFNGLPTDKIKNIID